ncbi:hypothetical protein BWI97_03685 [Siphonobacter sp. BAB-5405]|uniref:LiaI-LiaF-like domain-containing protein n=1 Tax=Siphonobacter sp. BAB-5405 TaxID=1864825 RepID=UPI000C80A5FB|nr:DUF5668 domain-containing protein [Siphonobacter sp. BAB-5405]PMD98640.1 hypothetical protein BWI97_03685 [Siphonobacter sp. BAB-5405]
MNAKNLLLGGFFVLLGILFLGRNLGWFDFHFGELLRLWPLLFVVLGVNMIWGKANRNVTVVTLILLAICVPLFIATKVRDRVRDNIHWNGSWDDDDQDDESEESYENRDSEQSGGKQYLAEPMTDSVNAASFQLEGGAAEFTMGTTDKQLVEADGDLDMGNLSLKSTSVNGASEVVLSMKGRKKWNWDEEHSHNNVAVRLNPQPLWNLDMKVGAGKADFDLTPFKVSKVSLHTGAAEMDLKLGDKTDQTDVEVNAGVASVKIKVPQSVGCRITTRGALTEKDFNGFTRQGDAYETPGYAGAKKKINIRFEGGIAEWKVERY